MHVSFNNFITNKLTYISLVRLSNVVNVSIFHTTETKEIKQEAKRDAFNAAFYLLVGLLFLLLLSER